jgi:hypothetical protein
MKVERDYARGVDSIVGEHSLAAFGPDLLAAYRDILGPGPGARGRALHGEEPHPLVLSEQDDVDVGGDPPRCGSSTPRSAAA